MLKNIKKNYGKYLFILVVIYAIFLRFYNLGIQSFWIDEGFSSYVSKEFLEHGFNFIKPEYFLHNISQVLSFKLFGISDFSARFPSIIFSILNIGIIYLIAINLWKDKKIAILSVLIFSFLTWEIIWARQARFYTLLQLLFSINIYFLVKIVKDFSLKYLYGGVFLIYIGILFHPFLYSNVVLLFLGLAYLAFLNYKKIDFKKINYKKVFLFILPFLTIFFIEFLRKYFAETKGIGTPGGFVLPDFIKKQRFPKYYGHLYGEMGLLVPISIISMVFFVFKRKILESIIFTFAIIFIFYVIAYKGKLFHTRYMLILYPLIILSSSYVIISIYNLIKDGFFNKFYLTFVLLLIFTTVNFTFLPKTFYYIDYTSPQPNFKGAYNKIPKNSKIISGFPMLCEWYYSEKGKCIYSIPLDYVGDKTKWNEILSRGKDNYTNLKYLTNIKDLEKNKNYFFILDNLTISRMLDKKLLKQIFKKSKILYDNGEKYNRIIVLKFKY